MIDQLFDGIISAAEKQRGSVHCDELRDMLNVVAEIPHDHALALRLKIADAIPSVSSPTGAGMLAIWLGASVEQGIEPGPTIEPVLGTLLRWTRTFVTNDDDETPDPEPESEALIGTELLGQSLVAHLARSPEWCEEIRGQESVTTELERVEHLTAGATWVMELLRKCSGHLTVLHAESPVGVRVSYENLSNCFHLFSLLQCALSDIMPGAQEPSDEILALALGEKEYEEAGDVAWWHFGHGNVPQADFSGTVFGEASPSTIAQIEGEQVILLWPPILQSRGWDAGFFQPILSSAMPRVTIEEELSEQQIAQWRAKLNLPS